MLNHQESYITFESEAGFRTLFEYATVGIIVVDHKGRIVIVNPYTENLFGYKNTELAGNSIEILIPHAVRNQHFSHREKYLHTPRNRQMGSGLDLHALKKDGSVMPVEISLSHYQSAGQTFVVAFINDITERKKAREMDKKYAAELEDEVKTRTADLVDSLEREKHLNEMKSRFVSLASHEFRTPLSTILTSISLADKYADAGEIEKHKKHVERIKSSVHMLTHILNDFLSLERLNQGKVSSTPETFFVDHFLKETMEEIEVLLKPGQKLEVTAPAHTEVLLNKKLLKNIIINLTSNAVKYTPEGKNISVHCSLNENLVCWKIEDEGIGIPECDHERLFSMFFRAGNVGSIKGTGLGLNIVKKYVDLMQGEITFTSEEGKGTRFIVTLPQIQGLPESPEEEELI
ncbi:MAG: PAS domain-containing sensor histidine kinase [Bacteroidia bacterium]